MTINDNPSKMGADVHCYCERLIGDSGQWFAKEVRHYLTDHYLINVPRNYFCFDILGYRAWDLSGINESGRSNQKVQMISRKYHFTNHYDSLSQPVRDSYVSYGIDAHSPNILYYEEFLAEGYLLKSSGDTFDILESVLGSAYREVNQAPNSVRLVYWFDN